MEPQETRKMEFKVRDPNENIQGEKIYRERAKN